MSDHFDQMTMPPSSLRVHSEFIPSSLRVHSGDLYHNSRTDVQNPRHKAKWHLLNIIVSLNALA